MFPVPPIIKPPMHIVAREDAHPGREIEQLTDGPREFGGITIWVGGGGGHTLASPSLRDALAKRAVAAGVGCDVGEAEKVAQENFANYYRRYRHHRDH